MSPRHDPAAPPVPDAAPLADPLLGFAGPVAGSNALVIASDGLDLLCRLLRHGCSAATMLRPAIRPEHESYDLVLAADVTDPAQIGWLVYQVKRALVPTGRFLAAIPAASLLSGEDIAGLLIRSLRLAGFVLVQSRTLRDGLLVRADLPMTGRASAMPRLVRRQA